MNRVEKARELFLAGYNCSQSVFAAFATEYGLDEKTALSISCGLGGGVGRMREVCGAVGGAALVFGLKYGEDKNVVYPEMQEFAQNFKAERGSIVCRDLLRNVKVTAGALAQERNDTYYRERPCLSVVELAASILENMLED